MDIRIRISYLFSEQEGSIIERNLTENASKTAKAIYLSPSYLHKMLKGKMPINPKQLAQLYGQTNKSSEVDFIPPLLGLAEFLGKVGWDYVNFPEKRVAILGNLERATQF